MVYVIGLLFICGASVWFYLMQEDSPYIKYFAMTAGALSGIGGSTILVLSLSITADLIDRNTVSARTNHYCTLSLGWQRRQRTEIEWKFGTTMLSFVGLNILELGCCCTTFIDVWLFTLDYTRSNWTGWDVLLSWRCGPVLDHWPICFVDCFWNFICSFFISCNSNASDNLPK